MTPAASFLYDNLLIRGQHHRGGSDVRVEKLSILGQPASIRKFAPQPIPENAPS